MKQPKISIIIPVYNVEQYLHRCVNSILLQTFTDWELLLIDDGSTDRSGELCDEYAKKENSISVFHKINGGVSSARNLGLDKAQGEWVTFIDADDYILFDFLKGLYRPIENGECVDFVHGGCYNVQNDEIVSVNQSYDNYIGDNPGYVFQMFRGLTVSKLFNLNTINHGFDGHPLRFDEDMKIAEDMAFTMDYLMAVRKYAFVEEKGYCYRCDNMSSVTKRHKVEYYVRIHEFQHLYEAIHNYSVRKKLCLEEYEPRKKQLGILLFNTILDLYRTDYKSKDRLYHMKNDITNEQIELLKYVHNNMVKSILAQILRKRNYLLFDVLSNIILKLY